MNNNMISLKKQFEIWNEHFKDKTEESNQIGYNSIRKQMLALAQNLASFKAYQQITILNPQSNLNNIIFKDVFCENYYISQSIRIRKLLSLDSRDYSLGFLWNDIKNKQFLSDELIKLYTSFNSASPKRTPTIDNVLENIAQLRVNHLINPKNKKIQKTIKTKLDNLLLFDNNKNLNDIYGFTNKYIAHSANYNNRQNIVNEINETMIEQAIKDLTIACSALHFFVTCNQTISLLLNNYADKLNSLDESQQQIVHEVFELVENESKDWISCGEKIINPLTP